MQDACDQGQCSGQTGHFQRESNLEPGSERATYLVLLLCMGAENIKVRRNHAQSQGGVTEHLLKARGLEWLNY